jgi:hypothetical protein
LVIGTLAPSMLHGLKGTAQLRILLIPEAPPYFLAMPP